MDSNIKVLVDELTKLYHRYQTESLRNDIMTCLDILKYYDFNDKNNQIFIGYVVRVLFIVTVKVEENIDLTTDLSNLVAKGYTTGNHRNIFRRKKSKNTNDFEKEVEFYIKRNYFDDEYERLQRLLLKRNAKLIGPVNDSLAGFNYEKILTNAIQLLDNQELVLRLQNVVILILKPFEIEKNEFLTKERLISKQLLAINEHRAKYLKQYNKLFLQTNN